MLSKVKRSMSQSHKTENLGGLIERLSEKSKSRKDVSIGMMIEAAGERSFGAMLLIPGLIALSPLSGIPGVPSIVGVMVLLLSGQLLIGRKKFWIPKIVSNRSVSRERFDKAMKYLRRLSSYVDNIFKQRLSKITQGVGLYTIAIICLILSLFSPILEVVPFAITGIGATLILFGLSLVARDGLLAILAICIFCGVAVVAVGYFL